MRVADHCLLTTDFCLLPTAFFLLLLAASSCCRKVLPALVDTVLVECKIASAVLSAEAAAEAKVAALQEEGAIAKTGAQAQIPHIRQVHTNRCHVR